MYLYFFVKRIEIYIMRYKSSNLLLLLFGERAHSGGYIVLVEDSLECF